MSSNLVLKESVEAVTTAFEESIKEVKDKIVTNENKSLANWERTKSISVIQAENTRKTAALGRVLDINYYAIFRRGKYFKLFLC